MRWVAFENFPNITENEAYFEGIPKALIALYLAGSPSNLDDCSFLREENCVKCTSILALELNISWN